MNNQPTITVRPEYTKSRLTKQIITVFMEDVFDFGARNKLCFWLKTKLSNDDMKYYLVTHRTVLNDRLQNDLESSVELTNWFQHKLTSSEMSEYLEKV